MSIICRKCFVTGEVLEKDKLLRFVVSPNGMLTPDIKCKLPGRGIWAKLDGKILKKIVEDKNVVKKINKNRKDKDLKKLIIDKNLIHIVLKLLIQGIKEKVSLAKRAGQVIAGFENIFAKIKNTSVKMVVFVDNDINEKEEKISNSEEKLTELCDKNNILFINWENEDIFSNIFLKDNVRYICFYKGNIYKNIFVEIKKLNVFLKTVN